MFTYYAIKYFIIEETWCDEIEDIVDCFNRCCSTILMLSLLPFILIMDIILSPIEILACITYLIKKRKN